MSKTTKVKAKEVVVENINQLLGKYSVKPVRPAKTMATVFEMQKTTMTNLERFTAYAKDFKAKERALKLEYRSAEKAKDMEAFSTASKQLAELQIANARDTKYTKFENAATGESANDTISTEMIINRQEFGADINRILANSNNATDFNTCCYVFNLLAKTAGLETVSANTQSFLNDFDRRIRELTILENEKLAAE